MTPDFQFTGFVPSDELTKKANRALDRLLSIAPYGSMAIALIQKDGASYRCAIEIYSKNGPFVACCVHELPETALEKAVRLLSTKLERWHDSRRAPQLQPRFSS